MISAPNIDYAAQGYFGAGETEQGDWIVWLDAQLAVSFRSSIASSVPVHSVTVIKIDPRGEASACQIMLPLHAVEDRHSVVMKTLRFGSEDATPIARSRAMLWVGISAGPTRVPELVLDILTHRNPRATRAEQLALTEAIWQGGLGVLADRLGKDVLSRYKSVAGWSCLYTAPQPPPAPDQARKPGATATLGRNGVRTAAVSADRGAPRFRR